MSVKSVIGAVSVFLVILCITSTARCDVSHVLGGESSVDTRTIEILRRNISDYLVELEHGGSPQMQLKQIYSASQQIVTGNLYTVQALLETPDGAKKCQIRILEKPWIDFCKVSVSCEQGGVYEVTFNSNRIGQDIAHNVAQALKPSSYYLPTPGAQFPSVPEYKPQPVSVLQNPFLDQLPQAPAFPTLAPLKPLQTFPPLKPQPIYKAPTLPPLKPLPTLAPLKPQPIYKAPTLPPLQPLPTLPPLKPQPIYKAPTLPPLKPLPTLAPLKPQPIYKVPTLPPLQPLPTLPPLKPQPIYKAPTLPPLKPLPTLPPFKPTIYHYNQPAVTIPTQLPPKIYVQPTTPIQHDFPIKPTLVPKPLPPKPELNVLPFDQVPPAGPVLDGYLNQLFHDFMIKYEREYIAEPSEMEYRFNVFKDNFQTMHEHSRADRLACEYSVTEFADLSNNEFERILGFDTSLLNATDIENAEIPEEGEGRSAGGDGEIPEHYDQREENLVTRVKFQGDCGACWAFVTTALIEGLCAKRTKTLQEFSEQSLIDCDNSNYGCKGGVPPNALKHISKRGGLELESVYPFEFEKKTCRFNPKTVRVKVAGAVGFKKNDEAGMARWLFKNGPIEVGVNAAPLKYYKGGVLNPTPQLCNPKKVNHAVTLIGYGVEVNTSTGEKLPYWIVKNQWGTRWGEGGYFRIARGKNACGLALHAYSAKLSNVPDNCLLNGA